MGTAPSKGSSESVSTLSPTRTPSLKLYEGCIIGQALGDSLGFLVEGEPAPNCEKFVKSELHVNTDFSTFIASLQVVDAEPSTLGAKTEPPAGDSLQAENVDSSPKSNLQVVNRAYGKGIVLGQISDDTQMAVAMLRAYAEAKTFTPETFAASLAAFFASGNVVGCGLGTAKAVAKLNRGTPWDKAGLPQGSAGNGASIRAAPIGLFTYDNEENLVSWAKQQAFITHQDNRCQAGSIVIAGAIAICLVCTPLPPAPIFLQKLSDLCRESSEEFSKNIQNLIEWVKWPAEKAAKKIRKCGLDYDDGSAGISGFVTSSTLWALYSFLNHQNSYWDCICTAIAAGGDTDSTAAMAGALSGAYLGIDQIPSNWATLVHDKKHTKYEDFIKLMHSCYEIKFP